MMMMRSILAAVLLSLCVACGACDSPAHAGPAYAPSPDLSGLNGAAAQRPPRTLTVSGSATLDITPDVLDVHMSLTAEHVRPKAAVAEVRAHQAALQKNVLALGLDKADVKVSEIALSPTYDPHSGAVTGYVA